MPLIRPPPQALPALAAALLLGAPAPCGADPAMPVRRAGLRELSFGLCMAAETDTGPGPPGARAPAGAHWSEAAARWTPAGWSFSPGARTAPAARSTRKEP